MSAATASAALTDTPKLRLPRPSRTQITVTVILGALLAVSVWSFILTAPTASQMAKGVDYAGRFLARTVPFIWPSFGDVLWLSALTLSIVICGTVLAAIISLPVAYLAARNTSPMRSTRWLGRIIGVMSRAAPDAILAMIFALVLGQGALAGILALGLHSVGMISKLTADAIEQIDEGPRLALRAAGASRSQEFWSGVWPQIMPSFIATVLHRTDINLRVSVILGFVGVYGLGYELSHHLQTLNYREALPYAIIIFILCVVFEVISSSVRQLLLGSTPTGRGLGARWMRRVARRGEARNTEEATDNPTATVRVRPWTRERVGVAFFGWGALIAILGSIVIAASQGVAITNFWLNLGISWGRLWPPALAPERWGLVAGALVDTVQIALAATIFALVLSFFIGAFAASNVAPTPAVRGGFRFFLVLVRGLPELLLALFFIILTGLGSGAAVLALGIGGVGLLGKLFADSLEEVRSGPERALRATGATRVQIFGAATLPQAAPALIGHWLYLFDTNVRAATILGIVGAPGIGFMLTSAARVNQHELLFLLMCLFIVVLLIEALSTWVRRLVA